MIITKSPLRISFFGGGTDFPAWFLKHGGMVISTTINKYCYLSVRRLPPFFDYKHRIVYSSIELVKTIDEIKHPSVRETMRFLKVKDGLEIHHDGDLPAKSGLGSSSSFTVGLVQALKGLVGKIVSPEDLTDAALHIEHDLIKEACGSQDQVAAAYGGFNKITFKSDDTIEVNPIIISDKHLRELGSGLLLFFTGISRYADEIERDKIQNIHEKAGHLNNISALTKEALHVLEGGSFSLLKFGNLLHEMWLSKWALSKKVSNETIDELYKKAISAGAYGGKLLGAGGGGFMLFVIEPWLKDKLIETMYPFIHVPFSFESEGSKVVLYSPNGH